jgi:peptidoglycan/LPS O-acetylase OafA/YrhL
MKLTYRPEIDGLRAIAISVVILYHANLNVFGHQLFKGGFIGVDIFFVISGYLITSIILKELVTTGSFSFKYFYERRIRRILPALFVVILVSLPFSWIYLLPQDLLNFSKSILYSLGFSSNYYFHYSSLEYAVGELRNPFLHTWSLSVEEQYYILFPIILLITFKYLRRYCFHILIFLFFVSLCLAEWTSRNHPSISFYFLHTRIWELLAGSILAFFEIKLGYRSKIKILNLILPLVGLVLIGHSVIFFDDKTVHPSFYTLSPIIGVCLIIWFSNKDELVTKILSTKFLVGIGLISYSLYLWHYPIFSFVTKMSFIDGSIFTKSIIVITVFVCSIISYYLIEIPFRKKNLNFKKISLVLLVKFLLIIIFCIHVTTLKFHPFLTKYNNENKNFELNYNYNNFDQRINIFIIGNSFADDLLRLFYYNKELNKKYYFYTAYADEYNGNFQIDCFLDFVEKNKQICKKVSFSFFQKQYMLSDYIIFTELLSERYLEIDLEKINNILKEDNKKFIVFLDDLGNANILDQYLYKYEKLPDASTLNYLERKLFKEKLKNRKIYTLLEKSKNKLSMNNITFITRSELYCDFSKQMCPLINNNNKIFTNKDHLTNNGANYFSIKGNLILEKLLNKQKNN